MTRVGRQVVLTRPRLPMFTAFIDEAALRRPIGSPAVMVEQCRHILRMVERPNIDVRVIPFDRGGHFGVISPFVLLEFPGPRFSRVRRSVKQMDLSRARWRKSTRSTDTSECVEIAFAPGEVGIRDSKNPDAGAILLPEPAWRTFTGRWTER